MRESQAAARTAGPLERAAARLWNVLNEGQAFLPVFAAATVILWAAGGGAGREGLVRLAGGAWALLPALAALVRWDYPLGLRWALVAPLAAGTPFLGPPPWSLWSLQAAAYGVFTVLVWGTLYYRLRIGTPWSNALRFPRLVLATCDTTSGNAGEQVPKFLLLGWLAAALALGEVPPWAVAAAGAALYGYGWLVHRVGFYWHPWEPRRAAREGWPGSSPGAGEGASLSSSACPTPGRGSAPSGRFRVRRAVVLVLDGCRVDLAEEEAPFLRTWLRRCCLRYTAVQPVYPARTVTCFTSMLTGAYPSRHGVTRNLVLRPPRCDSLMAALERKGRRGILLAVSHLHDVFPRYCRPFTAVMPGEEADAAILARARQVLEEEDPALLVVQLIGVDQMGHSRGVKSPDQRRCMRETDRELERFWRWLEATGRLRDTAVVICSDHGQSRGIGSHGHLAPGESPVLMGLYLPGCPPGVCSLPGSIASLAPTLALLLGIEPPRHAEAPPLPGPWEQPGPARDLWVVVPACNEEATVAQVVRRVPREELARRGLRTRVLVVDDGSQDGTAREAQAAGAQVIRHPRRRGLGAAVRTGLAWAWRAGAHVAVVVDADGQYPPEEIPRVVEPILAGAADCVLGSRFLGRRPPMAWSRYWGNRFFSALTSLLGGRALTDVQTGLRALSRPALGDAEIVTDYNYAQVLTLNLLRKGYRIGEVPIAYAPRRAGRSFVRFPEYPMRVLPAMIRERLRPLPPRGSYPMSRTEVQGPGFP